MRADGQPPQSQDRAVWQRSRDTDMAPDEPDRFLDFAGFAEGRLDAEDQARIAALLTQDRAAAEEVSHRVRVRPDSALAGRTLAAVELPVEVGMRIVAMRRGKEWIGSRTSCAT